MKNKNGDIILKEEFKGGLKYALFSNFSNYVEAFLELTDNAVSNRIPGKPLQLDILVSNKNFQITNFGGYGMDLEELQDFLAWGKIKKRREYDIGEYSQGGKAAMGYLGRSMIITASPFGKKIQYRFNDDDLHEYKLKEYPVMKIPSDTTEGFVRIEIGGLKRKMKDEDLGGALVDTYRPLIEKHEVIIEYNGERLKIKPFPIEQKVGEISFTIKNPATSLKQVRGWIGYLIPRSGIKGGLRCYKLGRLICDREFFGHPDASYKQTLNFLFGEVYLDHVTVTTNKTDFDRDSSEWIESQKEMHTILKPYVDELLGREIHEPSEEERERVKQVKAIVTELMKLRNQELKGTAGTDGVSFGQRTSEARGGKISPSHTITGRKNEPRTPPPPHAGGKRRRLKEFMEWDIRAMDESVRSKIEEHNGNKILAINNLFSGYKAARGNQLYLIETAAIQLARPTQEEKITPDEYIADYDELYAFFCDHLDTARENLRQKKLIKK